MSVAKAFMMQERVHLWRGFDTQRRPKRNCRCPSAFKAGTMTCRKAGNFVEKKQFSVAPSPNVPPAALEFAKANQPLPISPGPRRKTPAVKMEAPTTIAHHGSARRNALQIPKRIDPVLEGAIPSWFSGH